MSARDSFWTWRQAMYALANRITPEELQIVATQLFVEMLKAGYTSVAEFHYLHRAAGGARYSGANPLWDAISDAARTAGIGLTFLPTLYQSSDFGGQPLKPEQARFFLDTDEFLRAIEAAHRGGAAREQPHAAHRGGISQPARGAARSLAPGRARIAQHRCRACRCTSTSQSNCGKCAPASAATGRRPIELLLDQELLTQHWCVVHATHATAEELEGLAAAGAVVCVSISTEANLGDGFFDARALSQIWTGACALVPTVSRR